MSKLLNYSLKRIVICAAAVLVCVIPIYYVALSRLWQYELDEHNVIITPEAGREDKLLIIGAVTLLSALFFAVLLLALILVNRILSRGMWRPFYQTLQQIRQFDLENPDNIQFDKTNIAEFDELNESLRKLLQANIAAYNQQKEFADNASHELQTPLAIAQSKLELLSQSKALDNEEYSLIEAAQSALTRAGRINKNLLLLTKIENKQFADKEVIGLRELLNELCVQFSPFFEEKGSELKVTINAEPTVNGNKILLEILIGNLITNAIRHTLLPGNIYVTLAAGRLTVSNPGAESLNKAQLFKRFASASHNLPGTGLGLAIVKQIVMRYQWNVDYDFAEGYHHFILCFSKLKEVTAQ
ncbi:HAMP domain-containing histidine kinase [Chitinophaga horti]|uniref:histidine kinase n=1 Tax=Chitinophaga horti TaxID=2920382 RepID=A0ABY6IV42_9BACT|nr:HAMP domain-containing sensor histidine kinase [Chitinophaga horti]UYQ91236.1 HAMP domain-containing histidine kinase [Chitinophaga horti]